MYPVGYSSVYEIRQTPEFDRWLHRLRDRGVRARLLARIDSARLGNLGDVQALGGRLREMRLHFGPGYRIYFAQSGSRLLLILFAGDKSTQGKDIERAKRILAAYQQEESWRVL